MKKRQFHELLIDAERRAAIAEHEADAYRNQVKALIRELQRANGVEEENLVEAGQVFLFADDSAERCCECGSTEHGGRRFYENYKGDLFCWTCADGKKPAQSTPIPMPSVDASGQAWLNGKPWPSKEADRA